MLRPAAQAGRLLNQPRSRAANQAARLLSCGDARRRGGQRSGVPGGCRRQAGRLALKPSARRHCLCASISGWQRGASGPYVAVHSSRAACAWPGSRGHDQERAWVMCAWADGASAQGDAAWVYQQRAGTFRREPQQQRRSLVPQAVSRACLGVGAGAADLLLRLFGLGLRADVVVMSGGRGGGPAVCNQHRAPQPASPATLAGGQPSPCKPLPSTTPS